MAMQPTIARQNGRGVWLNNQLPATASQISSLQRQTPFFASCFHYLTKATFCWFLWVYRNKMTSFAGRSRKARGPDVARGQYNAQVWSTVNADSKCMPWYISDLQMYSKHLRCFWKTGFPIITSDVTSSVVSPSGCCVVYTVLGKLCQSKRNKLGK